MADSTIITGQFVRISQTPASIGERFIALLIDFFIMGVYLFSMLVLLIKTSFSHNIQSLVSVFGIFLPVLLYSFLFETFNQGQSIGKRLMNIRVVKADGSMPGISSYLLRWLLFMVDGPLTSGLGALVILLTKNSQRLGDLAADTMVIKEKNYRKIHVSLDEFDHLTQNYQPVYPQAADLSLEQVNVITRALQSGPKERPKRIEALSRQVKETLQIRVKESSSEAFLQTILRDYQFYALEEF